ncbi:MULTISPECIES: DsrE/DsrF/DrsH-like family protein [Rossellomorea]|uniref:DsrE/DsrF/DrsH-like family protein n=1 Tax=Rossellomorea vietnamensis TaxID=218284 RepID=A0ACD4C8F7_9BACI|nr:MULTISPECIES: DsrE/DsrF/DrsH-like family protein [Rossellomorea]MCA0148141.1 DsrE/DsrF/DrsH-like family protein [Rossellomorea vietnamensis]MCC5800719.1 DsrE/DsrF/DrsH-like family protein [Rossellomorea vietnamensis]UTE75846.1 DsrE/DsrF/DrsH-like family protein [Rossellomorea sp. KS-H15a]UXH44955.1 DsrE/DsrF/DrsH-like family protein [Rossellomorea vietnamensis]WGG43676.1 DsrE/DsrF/DrsH-like family protein [Rossellomorea sp. DA94]
MSKKVAIIASNGGLFDAYKVFNIATAAAATDQEVAIFFTFEGLNLIHKEGHKQLPMPEGKEHFQEGFAKANVPGIPELVEMAQEMGVSFIGCQMTMDVMGLDKEAFVDGIEVGGAVTFLEFAKDADVTLTF